MLDTSGGIAIVGIDCRYPGAHSLNEYWENILSLRQQFRRIPERRLNLEHYGAADRNAVDTTYSKNAAVLSGYHFDRVKYRISKSTYEQTDLTHWLSLDVATGALKDAGFEDGTGLVKDRVGVIVGNSLTGEFTRANLMRLRWPYVSGVMHATLSKMSYDEKEIIRILNAAEVMYKQPFPAPTADMLAGGLSNTIAGRICNYYDFHGGGYTIDGACSSSLLAIANACTAILNGELDVAIAGGVDLSIDAFELIGFARNGALAHDEMQVFSNKAQGFWPGEGCGMLVLMRESEAVKNGHNIYGVIKGWGISSDGKGGMTRPRKDTQQLAMERAYSRAGYDPSEVAYFEAHGTGTVLGDEIEMDGILSTIKKYGRNRNTAAVLGSVKQLIGHTKAAAGVAGLIKVLMSLKHKILPGAIKYGGVHPLLEKNSEYLTLPDTARIWDQPAILRAGVSSFGFGGINVHVTLEEDPQRKRIRKMPPSLRKLASSRRDCELFPVTASGPDTFVSKLEQLQRVAKSISRAELTDLSATMTNNMGRAARYRACLVAHTPEELYARITLLLQQVAKDVAFVIDIAQGIFYHSSPQVFKNAFLFPGQGAPTYDMHPVYESLQFEYSIPVLSGSTSSSPDTSAAQPLIINRTLQALELLQFYGVEGSYGIGHSLGEIAALTWGGVLTPELAGEVAATRGNMMSVYGEKNGGLLALKCKEEEAVTLVKEFTGINITGYNGIDSFVIGGHIEIIDAVQQAAIARNIPSTRLKVSHAFHTPMMKESAVRFREMLKPIDFNPVEKNVISTVTGEAISLNEDYVQHLFEQIEKPVLFKQAVEKVKDDILFFFEVGPGSTLTRCLQGYDHLNVIPVEFGHTSLRGFMQVLAAAFVSGNEVNFREISAGRHYNHFDLDNWELDVLENPCEAIMHPHPVSRDGDEPFIDSVVQETVKQPMPEIKVDTPLIDTVAGITGFLKQLVSRKMEMPVDRISDQDRIMSQLHINSLALTEIISIVIKNFGKSHKTLSAATVLASADGTIAELGQMIHAGDSAGHSDRNGEIDFSKLYNWTHIFKRHMVPKPAGRLTTLPNAGAVTIKGDAYWCNLLGTFFQQQTTGNAAIFVYDATNSVAYLDPFLQFLQDPAIRRQELIILVHISSEAATGDLKPVFRSFHHELQHIAAFSVNIHPEAPDPAALLLQELNTVSRYKEIHFDKSGQRAESEASVCFPAGGKIDDSLNKDDVILATGGGKGITYASVYELAAVSGASLALLGRALPGNDPVLAGNLKQLEEAGINYRYYAVDVLEEEKIGAVVKQVQADLGPVTVVLHGAGVNQPKRIDHLSIADFDLTQAAKVRGLQHLMAALDPAALKMVIGYGSVIAQSGMKGNADYAWANDQLAGYIAGLQPVCPQARLLTLEWSVWEETGMGIHLNSIDALRLEGISPIPVKNALSILKQIVSDADMDSGRYMITGRMGHTPTLAFTRRKPIAGRYISRILHHIPNVELITEVSIDLQSDLYLSHHQLDGQFIMPTVMILEGMAQVSQLLHPINGGTKVDNLDISRAIFIPSGAARLLRFVATRMDGKQVQVEVYSDETNFEQACFTATISPDEGTFKTAIPQAELQEAIHIDVNRLFYDSLLFHSGPFRRIKQFHQITALSSLAYAESSTGDQWFAAFLSEEKLLGDPGINDAAIHCHQACRPSQRLLPVKARCIRFNPVLLEGPLYIKTTELDEDGFDTTIDVVVMNAAGEIKVSWEGLVLRRVKAGDFKGPWHPVFLKPFLEYTLNHLSHQRNNRVILDDCIRVGEAAVNGSGSASIETGSYRLQFGAGDGQFGSLQDITLRMPGRELPVTLSIIESISSPIQLD